MRISFMLRGASWILMFAAVCLFLFDLTYQWIAMGRFKIRTVEEVWSAISKTGYAQGKMALQSVFPPQAWESFAHVPAPLAIVAVAVFFYAIFRLVFFITGESRSARL